MEFNHIVGHLANSAQALGLQHLESLARVSLDKSIALDYWLAEQRNVCAVAKLIMILGPAGHNNKSYSFIFVSY